MAYTLPAYTIMAYIVVAYLVMAYLVMAYIVMAYVGRGRSRRASEHVQQGRRRVESHAVFIGARGCSSSIVRGVRVRMVSTRARYL